MISDEVVKRGNVLEDQGGDPTAAVTPELLSLHEQLSKLKDELLHHTKSIAIAETWSNFGVFLLAAGLMCASLGWAVNAKSGTWRIAFFVIAALCICGGPVLSVKAKQWASKHRLELPKYNESIAQSIRDYELRVRKAMKIGN